MKKIININLSGRVIPIEDSAYESLQRYIDSLRRYFAAEEGRDEIINDIESRIAELMNDKIKKGATSVTDADINEIINSMGRIEDFEAADHAESFAGSENTGAKAEQSAFSYTQPGSKRFRGRLHRDASDKILGGVCSGIASYMNVDPAIVRLLFGIITFGGFGFGILIYVLLWIIVPAKNLEGYVGKRLFRNPEDRIIGGVAGGLGAYFNKESWMIRLIFAAPLLLNLLFGVFNGLFIAGHRELFPNVFFGSFTGTFILAYIILWVILPEARSPFEKMEMRGEKVDVNSIRQNVQEGMTDFKTKAQAWGEEVKTTAQDFSQRVGNFTGGQGKTIASEMSARARPVANGIGHVIGVLFKAFFLFIAGTIAFALFVVVLVFILGGIAQPFKDFLLNGYWQNLSLWGTLIFFLAVPLIAVITWIVRRLMKARSQNRYLGWIFGGLWTLGWFCLIMFIASMSKDFRYYNKTIEEVAVNQPALGGLTVRVDEPEVSYSGTYGFINTNGGDGFDVTEDTLTLSNIKVRVEKSNDSNYHVSIWRYSAGRNRTDAAQRATRITYSATSFDSALVLNSGFGISKEQKYRGQKVIVEIKVPVGKRVKFDESLENKLSNTNIRIRERKNWGNRDWDMDWNDDSYYNWKSNQDYIMTVNGELEVVGGESEPATDPNGVYEYRKDSDNTLNDSLKEKARDQLEEQIKQQRRVIDEEKQRLQDLQRKKENSRTTMTPTENVKQRFSENTAQIASPFFSLLVI